MNYSQNDEEQVIIKYFGGITGTLLDIGCNDGQTFSNSRRLIQMGWSGILVDAHDKAAQKCAALYNGVPNVIVVNAAIGEVDGDAVFYSGSDSLLSTLNADQTSLWPDTAFVAVTVKQMSWPTFAEKYGAHYGFITIDAEGMDYAILRQIDLKYTGMVCIEVGEDAEAIKSHMLDNGFRLHHVTPQNHIYAR